MHFVNFPSRRPLGPRTLVNVCVLLVFGIGYASPVRGGPPEFRIEENLATAIEACDGGDYRTAITARTRAANLGSTDAMTSLADMYFRGVGVVADAGRALALYRKAASQGDGVALMNVGDMHLNGYGVRRSSLEAYFWFRLAGRAGQVWAAEQAEFLGQNLTDKQRLQVEERLSRGIPSP